MARKVDLDYFLEDIQMNSYHLNHFFQKIIIKILHQVFYQLNHNFKSKD
jgi:hypothetical protein